MARFTVEDLRLLKRLVAKQHPEYVRLLGKIQTELEVQKIKRKGRSLRKASKT